MFPLARPLSARHTDNSPPADRFMIRLFTMSEKNTFPSASTAGPSVKATNAAVATCVSATSPAGKPTVVKSRGISNPPWFPLQIVDGKSVRDGPNER